MLKVHPQFIKDAKGNNSHVVLPAKEFDAILEELEDFADIRLYDEGKTSKEASIPIDEAFKIIEGKRKAKK